MNFRLPWRPTWQDTFYLVGLVFVAGAAGGVLTFLMQLFVAPVAASAILLAVCYVTGGLLGLFAFATHNHSSDDRWVQFQQIVIWTLAPPLLWLAVVGALLSESRSGSLLYMAVASIPAACIAADRLCTHVLYWMSANPRIELATLLNCRKAWQWRFWWWVLRCPTTQGTAVESLDLIRRLRTYPLRCPTIVVVVLLSAVLATLATHQSDLVTQRVTLLAAMTLGITVVGFVGTARYRRAGWTFIYCLLHWLYSGMNLVVPPWVFRSPLGSPVKRQLTFVLMLLLFTPAVIGATDWLCLFPPGELTNATDAASAFLSSDPVEGTLGAALSRILLIITVPSGLFLLTIFAHAAPVICQLNQLLERS
jgi:hypothetical protein